MLRTATRLPQSSGGIFIAKHDARPDISSQAQLASATRPVQITIKLTMITARKLDEAKSSRMTAPIFLNQKSPTGQTSAPKVSSTAFASLLTSQVDNDASNSHPWFWA
jgi:hypothetical protein